MWNVAHSRRFASIHVDRPLEDVGPVVVEAEDEAAVHLDAVVVEDADAPRVVGGAAASSSARRRGSRRRATRSRRRRRCSRPAPSRAPARVVGHVDGDGRAPDPLQRPQRPAEARAGTRGREPRLLSMKTAYGWPVRERTRATTCSGSRTWYGMRSAVGRQVAEAAAVVAAARGDQAGRRQEARRGQRGRARGGGVVAVRAAVVAAVDAARARPPRRRARISRPELHAFADRDRVGVRGRLLGAREDVQPAEDDQRAALAVPARPARTPARRTSGGP